MGYRVEEELANIGAATAVGRTPGVTGSLTFDGTTVAAAEFSADLSTLQSDRAQRDGQLHRQALETDTYPTATFTLTQPIDLGAVPADGQVVEATATGELTIHGTTKSVQIPLEARLSGNVVTVTGSIDIVFADYGISRPSSFMVLSIADHGNDGVPAPADQGPGLIPQATHSMPRPSDRTIPATTAGTSATIATSAQSERSSGVARNASDTPGITGMSAWVAMASRQAAARNVFRGRAPNGWLRLRFA